MPRRRLLYLPTLLLGVLLLPLLADQPVSRAAGETVPGPRIEIRSTGRTEIARVPAQSSVTRSAQAAQFVVNYDSGFQSNNQARAAFQRAVDIWSQQLTSSVPIVIEAEFKELAPNVLGSAGAEYLSRDFNGAPVANTWYAAALANKLAGTDRLPERHDINASFSSAANWYFGLDGQTPGDKSDFLSVVLHEIGHGLGFSGSGRVADGVGTVGTGGFPTIYDRNVLVGGQSVLGLASGSAVLTAALTGGNLFWGGPLGVAGNGGEPPKLYAPSEWRQGSSYSHLDEQLYGPGNPNSLMTPQISNGESSHDPGPITRGMLADMGWTTSDSQATVTATSTRTSTPSPTASVTLTPTPSGSPTATPVPASPVPGRVLMPISPRNLAPL